MQTDDESDVSEDSSRPLLRLLPTVVALLLSSAILALLVTSDLRSALAFSDSAEPSYAVAGTITPGKQGVMGRGSRPETQFYSCEGSSRRFSLDEGGPPKLPPGSVVPALLSQEHPQSFALGTLEHSFTGETPFGTLEYWGTKLLFTLLPVSLLLFLAFAALLFLFGKGAKNLASEFARVAATTFLLGLGVPAPLLIAGLLKHMVIEADLEVIAPMSESGSCFAYSFKDGRHAYRCSGNLRFFKRPFEVLATHQYGDYQVSAGALGKELHVLGEPNSSGWKLTILELSPSATVLRSATQQLASPEAPTLTFNDYEPIVQILSAQGELFYRDGKLSLPEVEATPQAALGQPVTVNALLLSHGLDDEKQKLAIFNNPQRPGSALHLTPASNYMGVPLWGGALFPTPVRCRLTYRPAKGSDEPREPSSPTRGTLLQLKCTVY